MMESVNLGFDHALKMTSCRRIHFLLEDSISWFRTLEHSNETFESEEVVPPGEGSGDIEY